MIHTVDEDYRKIVRAVVHSDEKRRKRKRTGKATAFDLAAEAAIKQAKKELELDGFSDDTRHVIIDKIYLSLLYNTPWELLGDTYVCRSLFYRYRTEFIYLVALHMGMIEAPGSSTKTTQSAVGK